MHFIWRQLPVAICRRTHTDRHTHTHSHTCRGGILVCRSAMHLLQNALRHLWACRDAVASCSPWHLAAHDTRHWHLQPRPFRTTLPLLPHWASLKLNPNVHSARAHLIREAKKSSACKLVKSVAGRTCHAACCRLKVAGARWQVAGGRLQAVASCS